MGDRGKKTSNLFEGLETHLDLVETRHLADVYHQGWYLDFGTPAQAKYTMGGWRSGWLPADEQTGATFANVGRRGRVYFNLDTPRELIVKVRVRGRGTQSLTPYFNNEQLQSVPVSNTDFADVEIPIGKEHTRIGENYLLLAFGGTTDIGGEQVAASVDSIWIREAGSAAGPTDPPTYEGLLAKLTVGKEERPALAMPYGSTLRQLVWVPKGAKLGFGVGGTTEDGVDVRVTVASDSAPPTSVFESKARNRWSDQLIDLAAYEGQLVRIDLTTGGTATGRVGWHAPRLLVPAGKSETPPKPHKNLIVLLVDTLRADKLKAFNPKTSVETPSISELAKSGVVFEQAQSPENWTKPSVASVLTGLHPQTHQQKTGESALPDSALLLSEHLKANEFKTGSFIANGYVSDRFGFDQGWDHYTNYIRETKSTEATNVFDEAANWIEANKDQRFFAYIQTIDPHVPYDPPGSYLQMYDKQEYSGPVRPRMTGDLLEKAKRRPPAVVFSERDKTRIEALHDAEITQHDHFLGKFIARLKKAGLWEDTLLVITSDHGEEFDDHGSWGHGHSVYQELLHVPLMFVSSRVHQGRRVPDVVSTMDIPATVTQALGVDPMPADEGRSLFGWLHGERQPPGPAVAFSDFQDDRRVVTTGHWKLVVRGNHVSSFFDLQADPGEKNRLEATALPLAWRYSRGLLGQFLGAGNKGDWLSAEQKGGTSLKREDAEMDDTIRSQLRELGYAH